MPLQHMQAPEKCFQSPQQAIFDTHKQTQILEQQQNQQLALQEVAINIYLVLIRVTIQVILLQGDF
jgi:hypothetical protein